MVFEAKSPKGWIGTIIQFYCLKAWFGSLKLGNLKLGMEARGKWM